MKLLSWIDSLGGTPSECVRLRRAHWIVIVGLALGAFIGTGALASKLPKSLLNGTVNPDLYFTSDVSRVHSNMVTTASNHRRTNVHPLFSVIMHPAYVALAAVTGENTEGNPRSDAAWKVSRWMSMIASGLVVAVFTLLLLRLGLRIGDCLLLVGLFFVSAFWIFWFSVPETYPWGVLTILLAFLLSTFSRGEKKWMAADFLVSLGTLAITTTNWMAGLGVTLLRWGWKRALVLSFAVLVAALGAATIQKYFFPSSSYFFRVSGEKNFVLKEDSGGVLPRLGSMAFHSFVMPAVEVGRHAHYEGKSTLRTQHSGVGSASVWGKVAVVAWAALLILGFYGLVVVPWYLPFRLAVGGFLLGQVVLHSVYGSETFLYSGHYGPVVLICVAAAVLTKLRRLTLGIMLVAIVTTSMNNFPQYTKVVQTLSEITAAQSAAMSTGLTH